MQATERTLLSLFHVQGHILDELATWPGGLVPDDKTDVDFAIAHMREVAGDSPAHVRLLDAADRCADAMRAYLSGGHDDTRFAAVMLAFGLFQAERENPRPKPRIH